MGETANPANPGTLTAPELASYWAQKLGRETESLVQLRGGINNHVFRCGTLGSYLVIKTYKACREEQRDRMQAEMEFLNYAAQVAPGFTPTLIEADPKNRCVILEYITGNSYHEGENPRHEDVQAAVSFFKYLNIDQGLAKSMINLDAKEGFLRLRQHMANVHERIAAMRTDHLPLSFKAQTTKFLEQLTEQAERINIRLEKQLTNNIVEDYLNPDHLCISPSDFGFHNVIRTPEGIKFIDFEFAGWDDPAKAATDFLLQPRVPVPKTTRLSFSGWLPEQSNEIILRQNALQPILQLKWACIILGFLNPKRLESMLLINQNMNIQKLISKRLASASPYLNGV